ncbi:hypothetical protein ACFRQM_40205 [Streptomyces sp. NPDC056831]|uniref:hypothetical protein n=1 Tax=Streptomyces sp. NPDC056831 TaxID=3345954 RepID=UPI003678DE42
MSSQLSMKDLTVKFRSKTTIWQTPEGSLYRVVQRSNDFEISTLASTGWIPLLHLHKDEESVADQDEAMSLWLRIQNPAQVEFRTKA